MAWCECSGGANFLMMMRDYVSFWASNGRDRGCTPVIFAKSAEGEERKRDEWDTENERVGK